jgi:hypothetical protein
MLLGAAVVRESHGRILCNSSARPGHPDQRLLFCRSGQAPRPLPAHRWSGTKDAGAERLCRHSAAWGVAGAHPSRPGRGGCAVAPRRLDSRTVWLLFPGAAVGHRGDPVRGGARTRQCRTCARWGSTRRHRAVQSVGRAGVRRYVTASRDRSEDRSTGPEWPAANLAPSIEKARAEVLF